LTTTALAAALALVVGGAGAVWQWTLSAEIAPSAAPGRSPRAAVAHPAPPVPAAKPAGAHDWGKPSLQLPADPAAAVLRLVRFVGLPEGPRTVLTIRADGRMTVEVPDGVFSLSPADLTKHASDWAAAEGPNGGPEPQKSKDFEGRLSADQLRELL